MNVFIAGVHGVGKTYLAKQIPESLGLFHTSASKLIKEERAAPNWSVDKRVSDVDGNQIALTTAVKRYNDAGTRLLLDGHFVLLNSLSEFVPLNANVFQSLNLERVVLLEAAPELIAERISERDDRNIGVAHISNFVGVERENAMKVCDLLRIPLIVLESPSVTVFIKAVSAFNRKES